jgi:biopolymer transport protein ExbD
MAELVSSPAKSGGSHLNRLPVRVDLTALVDLAFLLITFFMLTTTLSKPKTLPLVMPVTGPNEPVTASGTMTICLGKNNHAVCYVGTIEKPITAPKLIGYGSDMNNIIQTARQIAASSHKQMFVIIKPSDHSVYKDLVGTLDAMNVNGVASYAIAQIAPKDILLLKQKGIY